MIKPASSLCNMRCEYCFYHDVASSRESESFGIMSTDTARHIIRKAFDFADGESVAFSFQGGEPLLAGIEFFRYFADKAAELNEKKSPVFFGLQTNGTLISEEWARFFAEKDFLVGLSLDGDRQANRFRKDASGLGVHDTVCSAAKLLDRFGVEYNILAVLTGYSARNIDRIYSFFKNKKFKYLQFIPCLRPFGDKSESDKYMTAEDYKYFLIHAFNAYVKDYVRNEYTSVRQFDNLVQLWLGKAPEQCGMCGHCMHQLVVEGNGNVYPCDFYCLDEWLLGDINESDFRTMAESVRAKDFIEESLAIDERCRECRYYALCRGSGCKRSRADRDYCEAYKAFFDACLPMFRVFINEK
ncbi:MAG: SPASM domain-containing protein [Clostridiales bacterium]|nr:SPASM domain-containing protein [Clostridiales bacterium]